MSARYDFTKVPVVWTPKENRYTGTQKLMKAVEEKYIIKFDGYWDFHQWTVDNLAEFWTVMWDFAGVVCSKKYDKVIDLSRPMSESPEWFEGARLNYAENLLKYRDDHVALILAGEDSETTRVTFVELYEEAKLYTAAFRKFGVCKGDIVMCYMSNRKEAVIGMLATLSIGALWTGALPLMGHEAVLNRVSQVHPKILLTVDRFSNNRVEVEMLPKVKEIAKGLPSLQKVIIVPSTEESKRKDISKIKNSCFLEEFLTLGREMDGSVPDIEFEQVSLSYPIFLHFTSGTTGLPKVLVHGSGLLLTTAREFPCHMDMGRGDAFLSVSPVGWVSWTIFTAHLFCGCTLVLHEGAPFFLSPTSLWDMVDECNITHLLLTASVIDDLDKKRYLPTVKHHLSSLRFIMSGGSVVKRRAFDFIYNDLKLNVLFASIYGCTEIMGLTVADFTIPVYKGESPTPTFGTNMEAYDDITGKPLHGELGELVVTTPSPGLVLSLWGDKDGSKFREKYFSKYPERFFIGDSGFFNPVTKGLVICGRCDDTLKQRGCRIGCSEIYNSVEHFVEVYDALCVSQYNRDMDERGVLFLKMREGHAFNEELVRRIRERIASDLTPRHVPDVIIETGEIPFNTNGKKMEITVKKIINNFVCNNDAIANPDSLRFYRNRPELAGYY